ncbi:phosphate butyryltransferase [Planococcus lenghuensis]|uniref:phosphate butyryltransferase n=1 Tax=Planococcus lenghuensis TaxID=2213202 RepID=UPI0038CDC14A
MKLDDLINPEMPQATRTVSIAAAADSAVLETVSLAVGQGLCTFLLIDDRQELASLMADDFPHLVNHADVRTSHARDFTDAAAQAVKAVRENDAAVLMKGRIPTALLMKAVLHAEKGLRIGRTLSHVAAFEVAGYDRLIFITDAGMNPEPDLNSKAAIIQNAVEIAQKLGIEKPVVAPLAAVEIVNPKMQATLDAAALVAMNVRGQITGCIVDGPLALDNAVSVEAARHKGLTGETAGRADILLVPNIESGNILYKSLVYFAKAKVGAVITGAKAPIVLTSRSDSAQSKLYSLGLALHASD